MIADALALAHRQGFVHRDLKPDNILVTKSESSCWISASLSRAVEILVDRRDETVTQPLTPQGTIVGTMPYMPPEQLEGKETDARSDIFAFGAVLYEMLTGRKAFAGENQASLIAAIMS